MVDGISMVSFLLYCHIYFTIHRISFENKIMYKMSKNAIILFVLISTVN